MSVQRPRPHVPEQSFGEGSFSEWLCPTQGFKAVNLWEASSLQGWFTSKLNHKMQQGLASCAMSPSQLPPLRSPESTHRRSETRGCITCGGGRLRYRGSTEVSSAPIEPLFARRDFLGWNETFPPLVVQAFLRAEGYSDLFIFATRVITRAQYLRSNFAFSVATPFFFFLEKLGEKERRHQ